LRTGKTVRSMRDTLRGRMSEEKNPPLSRTVLTLGIYPRERDFLLTFLKNVPGMSTASSINPG